MPLYFAYGSNMDIRILQQRCQYWRFVETARLPNHRLAFNCWSHGWNGGVANIMPSLNSEVWGVIYELDHQGLSSLDFYEGAKLNPPLYQRTMLKVYNNDHQVIDALAYVATTPSTQEHTPSARYQSTLINGAWYWELPDAYIDSLRIV